MTLALALLLAFFAAFILADTIVAAVRLRRKKHNAQRGRTHA